MSKGRLKQFGKWLARQMAWLLILTIVANFVGAFVAPRKAQAVDVNDHMLLFWPSTNCADVPTGWSSVSTGGGDLDTYFPRGAASYSGKAGGSSTHTHVINSVTTTGIGTSLGDRSTGVDINEPGPSHIHTPNSATIDAGGNPTVLPKYGEMCVISYDNGIPTGDAAIPNGAVAIFDAAVPGGWNNYSGTFSAGSDTFIRGGTNSTGGANAHGGATHSLTSITLGASSGTIPGQGSNKSASTTAHTHTVNDTVSDTPDVQPPYMDIYLGQKSSAGPIPNGMIAMFDDTDSSVGFSVAGWTRLSDGGGPFNNRFLKVTGSYGTPGGNTTHTHTVTTTSNSGGDNANVAKAGVGGPIMGHDHNISIDLADGTNTNIPPYTDVVIAKKQTVTTVLTTDAGSYPDLGDIITVDATFNNYHASTNLVNTYVDYVIFIDGDADGRPDAGETYITDGCAGSAVWAAGNYTEQDTGISVNASASTNDQWTCDNSNFPQNTTYTLWSRWWDGTTYAYNIYYDKGSVTFTSVPTLTEILFLALVGCAVFLGVRTGVIKIKKNGRIEPGDIKSPPDNPANSIENINTNSHQNQSFPQRSIDGISHIERKK